MLVALTALIVGFAQPSAASAPVAPMAAHIGDTKEYSVALPAPPRDRLVSGDLALDVSVGLYSDCRGGQELTHDGAAIDTCLTGREYFIGHNPGPFTPLLNAVAGTRFTYYDSTGLPHPYRVVSARTWNRWSGSPPFTQSDVVAQFQTCLTLDANWDRILDAIPEPAA